MAAAKLFGGVIVGQASPTKLLRIILLSVAACNALLFAVQASSQGGTLIISSIIWMVNGVLQGLAWGALVGAFVATFPDPSERGSRYALLSGSQNAGSAAVALFLLPYSNDLATYAKQASRAEGASEGKWAALRASLLLPAVLCAAAGVLLPGVIASMVPEARVPPVDLVVRDAQAVKPAAAGNSSHGMLAALRDPRQLCIAGSYFCLSVVRTAVAVWALQFVPELAAGSVSPQTVGLALAAMEAGGFGGGVLAGAASDGLFGGRRGPAMVLACLVSCSMLCVLALGPGALGARVDLFSPGALCALFVGIGGGAFAAHVLAGLLARELAPPATREVAGGMVKAVAQLGSAAGAAPVGLVVAATGWHTGVLLLAALMAGAAAFALPLWHTRSPQAGTPTLSKSK